MVGLRRDLFDSTLNQCNPNFSSLQPKKTKTHRSAFTTTTKHCDILRKQFLLTAMLLMFKMFGGARNHRDADKNRVAGNLPG